MKILKSWINDFIEIKNLGADLDNILVNSGLEIDTKSSQINEQVYDLDVTSNRGDCLSHIGVAREIAAFSGSSVKKKPIKLMKPDPEHAANKIQLNIKDNKLCPQYFARIIDGVKIAPSPDWMQKRLIACGAKPINNVVDVTNYVLLDLGHPLHVFDYKKITDSKIIVRRAKNNEEIVTLDGEIRKLSSKMLVIADSKKPIALAGIIGGENSEVDNGTETVVLEAAEFDKKNIRKTAKDLNIVTEASYRFERGIDSGGIEYAINKAANLIVKITQGTILRGLVSYNSNLEKKVIKIEYDKINRLLGTEISPEEINHMLKLLGFEIAAGFCQVPSWRHDIDIWQDLTEEVGKIYGYRNIKRLALIKERNSLKTSFYYIQKIKDTLSDAGVVEIMNYPFLSEEDTKATKIEKHNLLEILNPLQEENKYLRNSLLPGLLKNIAKNPAFDKIEIFEIGNVFAKTKENVNLGIALSGKKAQKIEDLLEILTEKISLNKSDFKTMIIEKDELVKFKIKKELVSVAEINLSKIIDGLKIDQKLNLRINKKKITYRKVSKFPSVVRDLAFVVNNTVGSNDVANEIYQASKLINNVELFDEYKSEKIGKNMKNIAYHIFIQSDDKTLNESEAKEIIKDIIKNIELKYKAKLRK